MDGDQYESLSEAEMIQFVNTNEWIFAKSMPKQPHEYLLAWRSTDKELFFRFVMTIRRFGYDAMYHTMQIRYYWLGSRKYWTMGEFLETTYVLNRAFETESKPRLLNPVEFQPRKGRTVLKKTPMPHEKGCVVDSSDIQYRNMKGTA